MLNLRQNDLDNKIKNKQQRLSKIKYKRTKEQEKELNSFILSQYVGIK